MGHKLVVIGGKRAGLEILISTPQCLIGRGEDCHIRPQSPLVSRRHCVISVHDGKNVTIEDCGSINGTFVNGEKVERQRELKNNDRIRIGSLEFEVQLSADRPHAASRQPQTVHATASGRLSVKPQSKNDAAERQQPNSAPKASNRSTASVNLSADEAELLGWLGNSCECNAKKVVSPAAQAVSTAPHRPSNVGTPSGNTRNTNAPSLRVDKRACAGNAASPARSGKNGNTQTVANDKNHSTAELPNSLEDLFEKPAGPLADLLPRSTLEISDLLCNTPAVLELNEQNQTEKEWGGCDLLMLAAVGPLLVIMLSWCFPLSWPENFSVRMAAKWFLKNWWHVWWLRWGLVAVLAAALVLLLRRQARSRMRIRT
jgi:pSer/pThr/pTyr-binding forkhead associated (FHA) protein